LDEESVSLMADAVDKNQSGVIEPNEFVDWLWYGDMNDEARAGLASMC